MKENTLDCKIKLAEDKLKELRLEKNIQRNAKWNKESMDWAMENINKVYSNTLYFIGSKEEIKYWVYKVAGLECVEGKNEILLHMIYISDSSAKLELNTRIYSSCPYITHGIKLVPEEEWTEALSELIKLTNNI